MCWSHVLGHITIKKHEHCLQALQIHVSNVPNLNIIKAPIQKQPGLSVLVDSMDFSDNLCLPSPDPDLMDDTNYTLADLFSELRLNHMYSFSDYFEEIQRQLEEEKPLIMCLLHPGDTLSLEMESDMADMGDNDNSLFDAVIAEIEAT